MQHLTRFILRHRRLLLIALLSVTLLLGSEANRLRLQEEAIVTSLPVTHTEAATAVSAHATLQEDQHARDVEALSALIARDDLDALTRQDAAAQLSAMVANREGRLALEEALSATALAPCSAVVAGGSVTVVTAKAEITPEDSALVLTLAAAHCGAAPEDVRILPAE
ncbi:MAG: SpoIIIAH-like family protein [Clostridia bacterium]|nr:SpoIIIAH-like family protein [Clostridia bacterium]